MNISLKITQLRSIWTKSLLTSLFLVGFFGFNLNVSAAEYGAIVVDDFEGYPVGSSWPDVESTKVIDNCGLSGSSNRCLRVSYVPSWNGTPRLTRSFPLPPHDHYILSYDVFFEPGFEFVRGGKMHGLGSMNPTSGCDTENPDSWSARALFGRNGAARNYIYGQDRIEACGEGEVGTASIFEIGQWHRVELNVKLNSAANSYDGFVVMKVDGDVVADDRNLRLRGTVSQASLINTFLFSTFFGGDSTFWSPTKTIHARYDNFAITPLGDAGNIGVVQTESVTEGRRPEPPQLRLLSSSDLPPNRISSQDFDAHAPGAYTNRNWTSTFAGSNWVVGASEGRLELDDQRVRGDAGRAMKVLYPRNVYERGESGMKWQMQTGGDYRQLNLSYWIYFDESFDFGNGGILPGLGQTALSGDRNWQAFLSWKEFGFLSVDLISGAGFSERELLYRGQRPRLKKGEWQLLQLFIKLNDPGRDNGGVEVWIDNQQVAYINRVDFAPQSGNPGPMNQVIFYTYMEETSQRQVLNTRDQHSWFDDIVLSHRPL